MQDFCTEIGQFCSFFKIELAHRGRAFHETGVIVVHAVDVGPNLDFIGAHGCANQRGRIVRTTALEVGNVAFGVATNEALGDIDVISGMFAQQFVEMFADESRIGFAVAI